MASAAARTLVLALVLAWAGVRDVAAQSTVDPVVVLSLPDPGALVGIDARPSVRFVDATHAFVGGFRIELPTEAHPLGVLASDVLVGEAAVAIHRDDDRWYFVDGNGRWFVAKGFTGSLRALAIDPDDRVAQSVGVDAQRFLLRTEAGRVYLVDARGERPWRQPRPVASLTGLAGGRFLATWLPGYRVEVDASGRRPVIVEVLPGVDLDAATDLRRVPRALRPWSPDRSALSDRGPVRPVPGRTAEAPYAARIAAAQFVFAIATAAIPSTFDAPSTEATADARDRASHALVVMPDVARTSDGLVAWSSRRILRFDRRGRPWGAFEVSPNEVVLSVTAARIAWSGPGCDAAIATHHCALIDDRIVPIRLPRAIASEEGRARMLAIVGDDAVFAAVDRAVPSTAPRSLLWFVPLLEGEVLSVPIEGTLDGAGGSGADKGVRVASDGSIALVVRGAAGLSVVHIGPGHVFTTTVPDRALAWLALADDGFGVGIAADDRAALVTHDGGHTFAPLAGGPVEVDASPLCDATRCSVGTRLVGTASAMRPLLGLHGMPSAPRAVGPIAASALTEVDVPPRAADDGMDDADGAPERVAGGDAASGPSRPRLRLPDGTDLALDAFAGLDVASAFGAVRGDRHGLLRVVGGELQFFDGAGGYARVGRIADLVVDCSPRDAEALRVFVTMRPGTVDPFVHGETARTAEQGNRSRTYAIDHDRICLR